VKICIVGLPQSGKSSLFSALTGLSTESAAAKGTDPLAVVKVPDPRLERLAAIFEPKKKTAAAIEFVELQGLSAGDPKKTSFSEQFLGKLRTADALLAVVRSFSDPSVPHPMDSVDARRDLTAIETEILLSDLSIVENRIEKLTKQVAAKKNDRDVRELAALEKCRAVLESETPLRRADLTRTAVVGLSAKIEGEIGQLSASDAAGFRTDFGITRSALDRLIATAYRMMGLISFFTVGSDEVKAWTVNDGTVATRAAGVIHSDIERGFIRAEVVSFEQFVARGDISGCRTDGTLRLEGKSYPVRDGDIINFRFAV
jgi:ribosome-binding ATPase YchF (GTP1/OBG family)